MAWISIQVLKTQNLDNLKIPITHPSTLLHTTMSLLPGLREDFRVNFIVFTLKCLLWISPHPSPASHCAVLCGTIKACSFTSQRANISMAPILRLFVKHRDFNTHEDDSANTLASLLGIPPSILFSDAHECPNATKWMYLHLHPINTSISAITHPDDHP